MAANGPWPSTWIVMPILGARDYTVAAIQDCLAQSLPTRLLLINQGVADDFREELEQIAEEYDNRILLWSHQPPLQSLSATWNRALDFVWECGGTEALVVNNDVRLHRQTLERLHGVMGHTPSLFVSAVGVTADQFAALGPELPELPLIAPDVKGWGHPLNPGGPDFSCFLISHACHLAFRFDEHFIPAYCEDLDYHRRLLLAGHGAAIFSVNLPYLHYAAGTLKSADPARKAAIEQQIAAGSRQHYQAKWGGPVNAERFYTPFNRPMDEREDAEFGRRPAWEASTPALQGRLPSPPSPP